MKELSEDKPRLDKNPFSDEKEKEDVVSTLKDASQKSSQIEETEDLNPFGESSEEDEGVEIKDDERKVEAVAASKSVVRGYSHSFSRKEEPKVGMFYLQIIFAMADGNFDHLLGTSLIWLKKLNFIQS